MSDNALLFLEYCISNRGVPSKIIIDNETNEIYLLLLFLVNNIIVKVKIYDKNIKDKIDYIIQDKKTYNNIEYNDIDKLLKDITNNIYLELKENNL